MTTSGFSNQMVKGIPGVNNTHNRSRSMALSAFMTVTIGGKLNSTSSVQGGVAISQDCRFQNSSDTLAF